MSRILILATAGLKEDQLADQAHRRYPRVDYLELSRYLDVEVFDYTLYERTRLGGALRSLETQLRSDLYLTALGLWARRRYDLVFAMSERAGIPFSAFKAPAGLRPFVSMFQCWSERQEKVITSLSLLQRMDAIAVHCQSMKDHLVQLGALDGRTSILPYGVDHCFYLPTAGAAPEADLILSVGEIRSRDYGTLFSAVDGLPVQVTVAASGNWYAREKQTQLQDRVPDNVTITGRLASSELRTLYSRSRFVVVPVYDLVYSAGLTSVLEAGSMGRAVIATRSRGLADFVVDGETGLLVEPGDAAGMRAAIGYLLAHPAEARRMGSNARQRIEEKQNLDVYVQEMARFLQSYQQAPTSTHSS
jgi:glycosyltransferase involved in cell wall biosynthesis